MSAATGRPGGAERSCRTIRGVGRARRWSADGTPAELAARLSTACTSRRAPGTYEPRWAIQPMIRLVCAFAAPCRGAGCARTFAAAAASAKTTTTIEHESG